MSEKGKKGRGPDSLPTCRQIASSPAYAGRAPFSSAALELLHKIGAGPLIELTAREDGAALSRDVRRVLVALWVMCPPELRPTQAAIAQHVGCSVDTIQRDARCAQVAAINRRLVLAAWSGAVLASVRSGLLVVASRAAGGDIEALRECVALCERLGLDADALLGPKVAGLGAGGATDLTPLLAGGDAARALAAAWEAAGLGADQADATTQGSEGEGA